MGRLTAVSVRNAEPGRHADGGGLYLFVQPGGRRSWMLRVQVDGRRRDIGLGAVETASRAGADLIDIPLLHRRVLTLAEARDKCALLRKAALAGLDPVLERDRDRRGPPTFEQTAKLVFEDVKTQWKPRQQEAFLSSLRLHAFPHIGSRRVDHIEVADIQNVLKPIWTEKPDAARKVRQRIGLVLNYAHTRGWRKADAPGKSVAIGLGKAPKGGHYAAMKYTDVPAFVAAVQAKAQTMGRLALLFTIYTAARSGETRHARWSHIDVKARLWTRPAETMKAGKEHAVTLNNAAITVLEQVRLLRRLDDDLVFPSFKRMPLSDMTLSKVLRDEGQPYTVHGFRSSFRDWAAEKMPDIPDPVAEAALAHAVSDKVMAAYKRTNFAEMRRRLLEGWSAYATGVQFKAQSAAGEASADE